MAHSIFCSLYFIFIDVLLNFLVVFTLLFTKYDLKKCRIFLHLVQSIAIIDCVFLAINPFWEISIGYNYSDIPLAYYTFDMHGLYYSHLAYTYGLVALVLALLIIKTCKVAREYRAKYILCAVFILFIVIVNALFLYIPDMGILGRVDLSIATYSIAAILVYMCCFVLSKRTYIRSFESTIFHSLDQGIVIFDYDDVLLLTNDKAKIFLSGLVELKEELPLSVFLSKLGIRPDEHRGHDSYSLQIYTQSQGSLLSGRCDYKKLRAKNGKDVGHMFVISNAALETDILTGFQQWSYFDKFINENPGIFPIPTVVAVCDINALSLLNSTHGVATGDSAIKGLANALMDAFKSDAYYVRGKEAHLLVFIRNSNIADAKEKMESIKQQYRYSMQYAVSSTDEENPKLYDVITSTVSAMKTRKIMDKNSVHSNILNSMINTLSQCDPDTESHVKRTQIAGRMFAKRIALSDNQISQLELLCILHDIGKIGIPLEILNKPGKLTDEEWKIMETHVGKGYKIATSSPDFESIAPMILHHHERWDGKGYPAGLSKESIPLLSRIIAVIDAYDAMVSPRPYKDSMPAEEAIEELLRGAGTQFDPLIVSAFVQMLKEENEVLTKTISQSGLEASGIFNSSEKQDVSALDGTVDASSINKELPENGLNTHIFPIQYSRYILDSRSNIISVDDYFTTLTGYSSQDVSEMFLSQNDLVPEDERAAYIFTVQEQLGKNQMAFLEHHLLKKDGSIINVLCYGRQYFDSVSRSLRSELLVCDSTKTNTMLVHIHSEKERAQRQLRQWEETYRKDSLTSLLCHGAFVDDVETRLLKPKSRVALLLIDCDKFKVYNDTYGHRAGDEYLIMLSNAITNCIASNDLASRFGGDEFAIAINIDEDDSYTYVESMIHNYYEIINETMLHSFSPFGISMGVAFTNEESRSFIDLYDIADKALYESKKKDDKHLTFGNAF